MARNVVLRDNVVINRRGVIRDVIRSNVRRRVTYTVCAGRRRCVVPISRMVVGRRRDGDGAAHAGRDFREVPGRAFER